MIQKIDGTLAQITAENLTAFVAADLSGSCDFIETDGFAVVAVNIRHHFTLYEKIRSETGMGAALFHAGRCGACRIELYGADLNRVKSAPKDDVVRCEECRRIMVRTEESGL